MNASQMQYMNSSCVFLFGLVTPADYEPPGFAPCTSDNFQFEDEPMNIDVGSVATVGVNNT